MENTGLQQVPDAGARSSMPRLGWPARVAAVWAAAGGVAGGGLIALLLLLGRLHPEGSIPFALMLATVGGMLGVVHGGVLGYIGRVDAAHQVIRLRDRLAAVAAAVLALLLVVFVPLWLVMSAVLARSGSVWGWLAFTPAAAAAVVVLAWATHLGWRSLEHAYEQWPHHQLGIALVAGAFTVLCIVLLTVRPSIPGTALQLSAGSWIVVAALATIWLATPAIVLSLRVAAANGRLGGRRTATDDDADD